MNPGLENSCSHPRDPGTKYIDDILQKSVDHDDESSIAYKCAPMIGKNLDSFLMKSNEYETDFENQEHSKKMSPMGR